MSRPEYGKTKTVNLHEDVQDSKPITNLLETEVGIREKTQGKQVSTCFSS